MAPSKGPNGGRQVDAGDYHVEVVAKDTALTVYLHDEKDKPVDAQGHKGIGIFVVGGKPQRIELTAGQRQQTERNLLRATAGEGSRAPSRSHCRVAKPCRPSSSDVSRSTENKMMS